MPDRKKQKQQLMDYFTKMKVPTNCVVCGSEDWEIGRTGGEFEVGGGRKVLPVDMVCNFCGRIVTYNAYTIGSGK